MKRLALLLLLLLPPAVARAEVQPAAGPLPGWVRAVEAPGGAAAEGDLPLRVLLQDQQIRFHGATTSLYQHRILRIDKPEGLAAMQHLAVAWRPETDRVTIHTFRLTRGGRANDLLEVVRAVLASPAMAYAPLSVDGQRRLGLPIAGLAVGDVVELAYSIERAEPLLGGHHELVMDAGTHGGIDRLLLAARWDGDLPMAVAGRNLPAPLARGAADVLLQSDAPLGPSKVARLIEFSDFAEWGQVAGLFQPLFAEARRLAPASPLRGEIEAIRAAGGGAEAQAAAALTLARRRVKYLYVGLGEGNLRPLSADAVWARGLADCKGKAALLLALLDGLGIAAEAALVATHGGETMDRRLPNVTGFDHVIVRAEIGGKVWWLDPTVEEEAAHDPTLREAPRFGWALPVHAGAALEAMGPVRSARAGAGVATRP